MADMFVWLVVAVLVLIAGNFIRLVRDRRAEAKRRNDSLRFDPETGLYHWINATGGEESSDTHPAKPGGAWYEAEADALEHLRS